MFDKKNYFYLIVVFCFMTATLPFHVWAEEGSKKVASDQQDAESQLQISFDSRYYNVGEVWEGDKVSHTFTVKNTGTAELNIHKVKPG